jgi:hypothetical protein
VCYAIGVSLGERVLMLRVLLVLAAFVILYGCTQTSSPVEQKVNLRLESNPPLSTEPFLIGHTYGCVPLHHLPLLVLLMKDGRPTSGDLCVILQGPYDAARNPTDCPFDKRIEVFGGNFDDVGRIPHLLLEDLGHLLSLEPFIRVCPNQTNPLVTRSITVYH